MQLETISPEYVAQNRQLHSDNPGYGANGHKWGDRAWLMMMGLKGRSILDYGCGKGALKRWLDQEKPGVTVTEYDPAVPGKDSPPAQADIVVCADVLEHVEPGKVPVVLGHIAALARKGALLVVDTRPAKKTFPNGENAHLTIRPAQWWFDQISMFFDITTSQIVPGHGILMEVLSRQQMGRKIAISARPDLRTFEQPPEPAVYMPGGAGHTIMPAYAAGVGVGLLPVLEGQAPDANKVVVSWGLLRGTPYLYHRQRQQGGRFIYIDHGYFRRGHFNGHYRCVWDQFQQNTVLDVPSDRWEALGLELRPWKHNPDGVILVCPPSPTVIEVFGLEDWTRDTLARLDTIAPGRAVVRPKTEAATRPLVDVLPEVSCVVTYNSIAAVEAIFHGVPAIVDPCSAAAPVAGTDLLQVREPPRPDRTRWAHSLAYSQWTLKEMQHGVAHRMLMGQDNWARKPGAL